MKVTLIYTNESYDGGIDAAVVFTDDPDKAWEWYKGWAPKNHRAYHPPEFNRELTSTSIIIASDF